MLKGLWRRLINVLRGKTEAARVAVPDSRGETVHYEGAPPIPVEAPAERPRPALPIVFFNVGLDFGTSSTKVVVRDVLVGQSYVYALHPGLPGYPSYALPSAVRIHDDRIWFGPEAERRQGGRVFRSFKICLACQSHVGNCRGCETSEADAGRLGRFLLEGNDAIDARELVTLYLAYVIATVRGAIRKRFAIGRDVRLTYNMCLPIDQFEAGLGREAFVRALFLAEKLADSIRDGVSVRAAREAYRTIDAQYPVTPDEKERQTFVQPEAVAALLPFAVSRVAIDGLCGIVDVGAGTTDVAFFRLFDHGERSLSFYHARSAVVGADDVDRALYSAGRERAGRHTEEADRTILQEIRLSKQGLQRGDSFAWRSDGCEVKLDPAQVQGALSRVAERVFSEYQETWRGAYRMEPLQSRWESFRLFLIGGGSKLFAIRDPLRRTSPWEHIPPPSAAAMPIPSDLVWVTADGSTAAAADFDLLAVAYGLSFHPAQFPPTWLPGDMRPLDLPRLPRVPPDVDEWYPK